MARRHEIAHPTGHIFYNNAESACQRIEEIMQQIRALQHYRQPVLRQALTHFLQQNTNPHERPIADAATQVEICFLHRHYLSRQDILTCRGVNLDEFKQHCIPPRGSAGVITGAVGLGRQ